MPKGYLIANVTVTDMNRCQQWRSEVPAVIERHGGTQSQVLLVEGT